MPAELIVWLVLGFVALVALHEMTHVLIARFHGHPTVCVAINPVGVAVVFEDSPRARYWLAQVILPAATPMIAAGMRVAIGIALVVTVISEMIAGSGGLGYYIIQMQYALRPEPMYAAVISLAASGYLLNRIFVTLERRWIPWLGR